MRRSLVQKVSVLYVDARGHYPHLVADWYDQKRDAKLYRGPNPVVAHPPCGPWGKLRTLCTKQDSACGPHAVEIVREFGGVLEHPSNSSLFAYCGLPYPGELPDAWGGFTILVHQVAWGHCCNKPTWLYMVGVNHEHLLTSIREGGTPTHRVTSGPGGLSLPSASKKKRAISPLSFARFLVGLAQSVHETA